MAQPMVRRGAQRWAIGQEVRVAAAAVRRAPRTLVVREVVLQVLAAALNVTATAFGAGALGVVLLTLATAVVLLARLRWPAGATVAAGGLMAFVAPGAWLAALLVAFRLGRSETRARRLLLVLAAAGVLGVALSPLVPGQEGSLVNLLAAVVGVVYLLGAPALAGALLGRRRPAARLLAERNDYLERARSLTAAQARSEERARITAEMHDLLGHRLSLLSVHAGALEVRTERQAPEVSEQANLVRATAVAALDELRTTLAATRAASGPSSPAPEGGSGSQGDVAALARGWRAVGADVTVHWHDQVEGPLDPRVGRAVDRAVREGLTNAHKHAPGTQVTVEMARTPGRVRAAVRNTAPARATPPGPGTRLGLLGLDERARLLGGTATWGAARDGGFGVVLDVPAHPSPAPEPAWASASPTVAPLPPPPVREIDVLTWRRTAVIALIALALALPLALVLAGTVVELFLP